MKIETLAYEHCGTKLEGIVTYDESKGKRPGIMIFPSWKGRDDFVVDKARWLAKLGYVGCAVDLYGKGVVGSSIEENSHLMEPFIKDRKYLQDRMQIALQALQNHSMVDSQSIAAMGFCFGGLCALDLARSGATIQGVVSLHGLLIPPKDQKNMVIKAKILVLHGYDDPMVPPKQLFDFEQEMSLLKVDWQVHIYGGTQHAFTNPAANDPTLGTVYHAISANRSLQTTIDFFTEIL